MHVRQLDHVRLRVGHLPEQAAEDVAEVAAWGRPDALGVGVAHDDPVLPEAELPLVALRRRRQPDLHAPRRTSKTAGG